MASMAVARHFLASGSSLDVTEVSAGLASAEVVSARSKLTLKPYAEAASP